MLAISVLSSLLLTTSAQTACKGQAFTENKVFTTCRDLPHLSSYLHWTFDQATGKLDIAFRHTGISGTDKWVAWAINPSNNLNSAMTGAQALVAIIPSSGAPNAYTSSIQNPGTTLAEGAISYNHSGLTATHQSTEVTIYATLTLPSGTTTLVHLWNDGPVSSGTPAMHAMTSSNTQSKESLDLLSGSSQAGSGNSLRRRRNVSTCYSTCFFFFPANVGFVREGIEPTTFPFPLNHPIHLILPAWFPWHQTIRDVWKFVFFFFRENN